MSTSVGKVVPYATARPAPARRPGKKRGILRHSDWAAWDALLILLAAAHAALIYSFPYFPVIALGLWWNSNTVAHYFIHRPFFRFGYLNVAFSLFLSVLLGVPQTLWRERHLAHHAGKAWHFRMTGRLAVELFLILALWSFLIFRDARFFFLTYLPAYAFGLGLCWIHGHYEHARGTLSHYGRLYNFLFLNDGYHVEHHAHPAEHWTRLPHRIEIGAPTSRWPAVLRWVETPILESLERGVLRSRMLQRFVLHRHEAAFRRLLPKLPPVRKIAIVGGGLFPRTLIILERLLPEAEFIVIDRSAANIQLARHLVEGKATFLNQTYAPAQVHDMDLVVFPLSFVGDRQAIFQSLPAPAVVIHDWLWRRRGITSIVSFFLLKRLNLVRR
jgi:fatty acid desaturase